MVYAIPQTGLESPRRVWRVVESFRGVIFSLLLHITILGAAWLQPGGVSHTGGGDLAINVELAFESLTAEPASVDLDNRKTTTVDAAPVPPPVSPTVSLPKPVPTLEPEPAIQQVGPQPEPDSRSTSEPEPAPALATTPTPIPEALPEPRVSVNTTADPEPAPLMPLAPLATPRPRPKIKPDRIPESVSEPKPTPALDSRPAPAATPPKPMAPKKSAPGSQQVARATPSKNLVRPGADKPDAGVLNVYLVKYRRKLMLLLEKKTKRHPDVVATMRILNQLQAKPVALSERDLTRIYQQVASCWEPPDSQENSIDPIIELEILLDPEGRVVEARALDAGRGKTDPGYREASAAAIRAVQKCSRLWLPLGAYQSWQSLILTLDPTERYAKKRVSRVLKKFLAP